MSDAARLAGESRCSMVAAAGCGKTQLIAEAVARHSHGRQLVLTHTHAGVDALRSRLRRLGAIPGSFRVDTIASWALRLAAHFPRSSGVIEVPANDAEWTPVYGAAAMLLARSPLREVLRASYTGVYVDEYQDCSRGQHDLIIAISESLPCRVLGDPLQGIYDFREMRPGFWEEDVEARFSPVPGPAEPRRWQGTNPDLGRWLQGARDRLRQNQHIDLTGSPVAWVRCMDPGRRRIMELQTCRAAANRDGESTTVIMKWRNQTYPIAQGLNGMYSCIEIAEGRDLINVAEQLDGTIGPARAAAVIAFAAQCMTQVRRSLGSVSTAFNAGREPGPRVRVCPDQKAALLRVSRESGDDSLLPALDSIANLPGTAIYRRELFHPMRRVLKSAMAHPGIPLATIAEEMLQRACFLGRRYPLRSIGTTLLVKGLEFDHVVILGPEQLDARHLYVALTRGTRSVTVVSPTPILTPAGG